MDKRCLALGLLFLALPLTAAADRHRIGARGALTNPRRSSLVGFQGSLDFPLAGKKEPDCCCAKDPLVCCQDKGVAHCPRELGDQSDQLHQKGAPQTFSAIFQGSFASGEHEGEDIEQYTYLSGLRYALNHTFGEKVHLYVQALMGGSHDSRGEIRDQPLVSLGGGLHVPINGHAWALSLQVERFGLLAGSQEWYTEISVGLVWRHER